MTELTPLLRKPSALLFPGEIEGVKWVVVVDEDNGADRVRGAVLGDRAERGDIAVFVTSDD